MKFVVWLLVCAICVLAEESPPPETSPQESPPLYGERGSRFINLKQLYDNSIETNEISQEGKEEEPNAALEGYTDCVLKFSLPCLQKKFLVFLDKLGRMEGFSLLGDFLSVKRTTKEKMKPISEKVIDARMNSEEELNSLMEFSIDRFFNTHKFHVALPFGMTVLDDHATGRSLRTGRNTLDIGFQDDGVTEGRTKKLIKKKILTLLVTMAKAKFAFLVPLAAILIKIKAIKALIFAKLALFLAIFTALKKAGVGAAGLGALGLGGAGLGAAGLGLGGLGAAAGASQLSAPVQTVGTTYTQAQPIVNTASHTTGGSKIVIIHDPHHVGGGGGGGGGHSHGHHGHGPSHGHTVSTGYDGYGPSGGSGSWSSGGGGDSYGPGSSGGGYHDSGGWGRSWSPTDPSNPHYRHNATNETKPTT